MQSSFEPYPQQEREIPIGNPEGRGPAKDYTALISGTESLNTHERRQSSRRHPRSPGARTPPAEALHPLSRK